MLMKCYHILTCPLFVLSNEKNGIQADETTHNINQKDMMKIIRPETVLSTYPMLIPKSGPDFLTISNKLTCVPEFQISS